MAIKIMVSIMDDTANPEEEWESREELVDLDLLNYSRNPRQTMKLVAADLADKVYSDLYGEISL